MQAIGLIINEYLKVINNNEHITLRDFFKIYKASLKDMESRMCARYSYRTNHTCFVCKNEIFSITNYLSNFTQTLFSVVDFLGRISPIKSEKIIFENILSNVAGLSSGFIFFNLFFQYKMICERVEEFCIEGKIIPNKLNIFLEMSKGTFDFLDVSLEISLLEFANICSSKNQLHFYSRSFYNQNRDDKTNKVFRKYWNKIFSVYEYFDFSLESSDSDNSIKYPNLDLDDYEDNKDYYDYNEDEILEFVDVLLIIYPLKSITSSI
jgi:hypothetical protein